MSASEVGDGEGRSEHVVRAAIILEIPEPLAGEVRSVQDRYAYGQGAPLPVHITLAGSNGLGELELHDGAGAILPILDAIARASAPVAASFGPTLRFPGTDTFALTLMDENPVAAVHRAIAESGLRFGPTPFPFKPHCTLTSGTRRTDDEVADLLATRIRGTFVLDVLSVYAMSPPMPLLHRASLTSAAQR